MVRSWGQKEKDLPDNSFPIWLHIGPGTGTLQEVWRWQDLCLGTPCIDCWKTISLPWGGYSWYSGWEVGWFLSCLERSWSWDLDPREFLVLICKGEGGQKFDWRHGQRCQCYWTPQLIWFWSWSSCWCCWRILSCSTGLLGAIRRACQGRHIWSERIHWGQRTTRDRNHRTGHSSCQWLVWGVWSWQRVVE